MRPHDRRPGLSLAEVLVALFVMALGLMALLTLFPLGAMQVGQALKDDRTAQTAHQADAWVRAWWRAVASGYGTDPSGLPADPALHALDDPNLADRRFNATRPDVFTLTYCPRLYGASATASAYLPYMMEPRQAPPAPLRSPVNPVTDLTVHPLADAAPFPLPNLADPFQRYAFAPPPRASGPSFPLVLDPLGYRSRDANNLEKTAVGRKGGAATNVGAVYGRNPAATHPSPLAMPLLVPRRNPQAIPDAQAAYATCALTDDLTFQTNGSAGQGEPLNRQGRYHWSAVIQRPDNAAPAEATLTILVFDGRPAFLSFPGDEVVLTNDPDNLVVFHTGVTAGSRSISLNVPTRGADQPPLVRRGGWVGVASMDLVGVPDPRRGLTFHRITGLTTGDETTQPQFAGGGAPTVAVTPVALDLDPPLPARVSVRSPQVYLLANLSEVFVMPDKLTVR